MPLRLGTYGSAIPDSTQPRARPVCVLDSKIALNHYGSQYDFL